VVPGERVRRAAPKEVAEQRIDAAVAAGGTVVDEAPTFVVLADPEGNKICICS
jgi:4a-hydroxytetrahydrobiopterin dehydratase